MCKPIPNEEHVNVLGTLASACLAFPKLRAGQLMINAIEWSFQSENVAELGLIGSRDLYYVTDQQLVKALDAYTREFGYGEG